MNATRPLPTILAALLAISVLLVAPAPARAPAELAPPESLEAWMPADCAAYVKFQGLGKGLDAFLKSQARKDLEAIPVVQFILAQEPWRKFQEGLADFRTTGGKDPYQVFRDLLGLEVVIAHNPQDGGVLLLARAAGEKELESALQAIRQAIGRKIGFNLEGSRTTHGERSIETIGEASFVSVGRVFALGNRMPALEAVIDLAEGKAKGSLKESPLFEKATRSGGKDSVVTLALRPKELPNFRMPGKLDNPLASLVLGGLAEALAGSEILSGALRIAEGSVDLEFSTFTSQAKAGDKQGAFFPPSSGPDPLADRLAKRGVLAIGEFHRDLKKWWDQRDQNLEAPAVGELIKFDQIMSVLFGGRSFQDEVLPQIGSTITLVAQNQGYKDLAERPKPSIPGFAGLFELKEEGKDLNTTLVGGFQTFIGLLNAKVGKNESGMGPSYILKTEMAGDVEIHVAAAKVPKDAKPELMANISPALAVVGSRLVISSSAELARALVEDLKGIKAGTTTTTAASRAADSLRIDSVPVSAILRENLGFIVQDNMSKKGVSREQAEDEMNAVIDVLKRIRDFSLETKKDGDQVRMLVKLRHSLGSGGADAPPKAKEEEKKPVSF